MELKVSSQQPGGLSPERDSDPDEKEFSDDDDDDRNHKHRRRETRSQSLEMDSTEQVFTRPYRKHNKPFENGHVFRGTGSQSNEGWKNNIAPSERESFSKLDKRHNGTLMSNRAHPEFNQRFRNQPFTGNSGPGRGRGRDLWSLHDPRFHSIDPGSQVAHQGPIPPSLFAGRGLPSVSNAPSAPWGAYGLIPAVPNGGLDALHSLNMQAGLHPSVNSSLNVRIPRQRCRDFEERGFCLRGDMCPMEHGVNRIVIEDVQSLSQFNLPVSISTAHAMGSASGAGSLHSGNYSSSSGRVHNKGNKPGVDDDGFEPNEAFEGSSAAGGDFYDPDQPLWSTEGPESSHTLLALHSSKNNESESVLDGDPSCHLSGGLSNDPASEQLLRSTEGGVCSQNTPIWGRMHNSKNRSVNKGNVNSTTEIIDQNNQVTREDPETITSVQAPSHQGKGVISEGCVMKSGESSFRHNNGLRNSRKPSQKAKRSLFVSGIPLKSNRKEVLLSHFRKFGQVIDIHIPVNTQGAFVQFSKREEAEAALKAPDAVLGNRFIKLFWANRDSIPDDQMNDGNSGSIAAHGTATALNPPQPASSDMGKDNVNVQVSKGSLSSSASDASLPVADQLKSVTPTDSIGLVPNPKKLENLELLKEELRKKQEMLDQKRNEFKRKLEKLAKQKNEVLMEPTVKRQKVGASAEVPKAVTPGPSEPASAIASPKVEIVPDMNKSGGEVVTDGSNSASPLVPMDRINLKNPIRSSTAIGSSLKVNRFKLDNRPNAFRIVPPLPHGLADVDKLKEHFSQYGDISSVELEDQETLGTGGSDVSCGARVTFATRRSAESAFSKGKWWQEYNLQFAWIKPTGLDNDHKCTDKSASNLKDHVHDNANMVNDDEHQEIIATVNEGSINPEKSCQSLDAGGALTKDAVISNTEESEDSERRNDSIEQDNPEKDLKSDTTQNKLDDEQSPRHDSR